MSIWGDIGSFVGDVGRGDWGGALGGLGSLGVDSLGWASSPFKGAWQTLQQLGHGDNLGTAIGGGLNKFADDATMGIVPNISNAFHDPLGTLSRVPGGILNAGNDAIYGMTQAAGGLVQGAGNLFGNKDISNAGAGISNGVMDFKNASLNDPIGSGMVIGGGLLSATGVGGPIGASLMGSGYGRLANGAMMNRASIDGLLPQGAGPGGPPPTATMQVPSIQAPAGFMPQQTGGGYNFGAFNPQSGALGGGYNSGGWGGGYGGYGSYRPTEYLNQQLEGSRMQQLRQQGGY